MQNSLKSFVYLDEDTIDEFVSQLDGSLLEGSYVEKTSSQQGKEKNLQFGVQNLSVGGKVNSSTSYEVSQTRTENAVTKFSRLYAYMQEERMIQPLSGFDSDIYASLGAGEIFEAQGELEIIHRWQRVREELRKTLDRAARIATLNFAEDAYEFEYEEELAAWEGLNELGGGDHLISIFTPMNGFSIDGVSLRFLSKLIKKRLTRNEDELEGDVTILGKIRRILQPSENLDLFRLFPKLRNVETSLLPKMGEDMKQLISESFYGPLIEFPGIEIFPIAIFR